MLCDESLSTKGQSNMPDYEKLLQANLPEALESAVESLNRSYDQPEQLLQADVSAFEGLDCCVFAYFSRDDVFYVNRAGRALLAARTPLLHKSPVKPPPIFWLDDEPSFVAADRLVASRGQPLLNLQELVTLSWGKTWFVGAKFPIQSITGQNLAILFAGKEIPASQQIRQVAEHYRSRNCGLGDN